MKPDDESEATSQGPRAVTQPVPQRRPGVTNPGFGTQAIPSDSTVTPSMTPQPTRVGGGTRTGALPKTPKSKTPRFFPPQPRNLAETGLSGSMVEELILKALFFAGEMRGSELSLRIKLPQSLIDEVLDGLKKQKLVDVKGAGGLGVGKSSMVFQLTVYSNELVKQSLERSRYNGPAPVRVEDWFEAVAAQTLRNSRVNRASMEPHFQHLLVDDSIFESLGPALNSGRGVFFFGAPGNGKTSICQSAVRCYEGDIYVPHALLVDDYIIRIFDETLHEPVPEDDGERAVDSRWVRCRRPLVVVGGELTLQTLDLIWTPDSRFYEAPFQLKAMNGMLLIDDFGRQKVSPRELLNRWIVPLENDIDYLTLHTGKKLKVPFDCFVAFSTNLDPAALVDDAFLRRVRYKVEVPAPDAEQFHAIFRRVCEQRDVPYDDEMVDYLIDTHYRPYGRVFAACHPRDLVQQVIDIAHYRDETPQLTQDLLDAAAHNYFVKFDSTSSAS